MAKKSDSGEVFAVRLSTPDAKRIRRVVRSKTNASHKYSVSDAGREAWALYLAKYAHAAELVSTSRNSNARAAA